MAKKDKPWLQRPEEGDKPYAAFWCYVSLGLGRRTYLRVSKELGKSNKLIERWAAEYEWTKRVRAYDASIVEEARQKVIDEEAEMIARHKRLGQFLQKKATDGFVDRDLKKASFHSLTIMMERGIQIEKDAKLTEKEKDKMERGTASSPMLQLVESLRAGEGNGVS